MATSFPGGLDNFTNPTSGDNLNSVTVPHATQHANLNDAVEAIEAELGVNPSGVAATVAARFADVEADVAAIAPDATVFHVDSYGAVGDGVTDDTTAIRNTIAAAAVNGGTVQFGAKTYLVNGPLVTSENGYAILPVPLGRRPIRFRGVQPANNCDPRIDTGLYSIVKTTKTGATRDATFGVPSVLGGPNRTSWVESMVSVENLCFWLPANPSLAGVDLVRVRRILVDGVAVIGTNVGDTDYTAPTSVHAFGVRTPEVQNYNACLIRSGQAHGMYAGLVGSVESLTVGYWVSKWCRVGWAPMPGGHGGSALKMALEWCTYHVSGWSETGGVGSVATGPNGETAAQVSVTELAVEDAPAGQWYSTTAHVNDSTNRLKGVVYFDRYDGTAPSSSLTKNGATGLTLVSLLSPSFGSGGGSTQYTKRDRLTAAGANDTLTLGADPIADSVHVWVNNVIKWPGVDYTRSGRVLTLTPALTAGNVVLSSYQTTDPAAPSAALSTSVAPTFPDRVASLSPLAYWKHDEASGGLADSSGNARTIAPSGVLSYTQASLLANGTGKSVLYNGGYASIASAAWMETDFVSVVLRYQPRSGDLTGNKPIITRWLGGLATDYAWLLWLSSGKVQAHAKPNGGTSGAANGATSLVAGTTYTVGMTWDGTTVKVYLNGVLDGSAALAGVLQKGSTAPIEISRISAPTGAVGGGYIDEVAVFGTALSSTDMANLHTSAIAV